MLKFKVVGQEKLLVPDVEQQYHINPLDDFKWVAGADVQKVWRKQGWVPPSEYRNDYLFMKNREGK
jgi:hypothetical protein